MKHHLKFFNWVLIIGEKPLSLKMLQSQVSNTLLEKRPSYTRCQNSQCEEQPIQAVVLTGLKARQPLISVVWGIISSPVITECAAVGHIPSQSCPRPLGSTSRLSCPLPASHSHSQFPAGSDTTAARELQLSVM